jgi:hypothetical protein
MSQSSSTHSDTMGESHRDRAIRFSGMAGCTEGQAAIVHALLAVEEQLKSVAYVVGHGGDTRRLDCEDPSRLAKSESQGEREPW